MKKILILAILSSFLLACGATAPLKPSDDNQFAKNYQARNQPAPILLVPLNPKYKEFEQGAEIVLQEIGKQLIEKGWDTVTIEKSNYQQVWSKVINQVGGIYSAMSGRVDKKKYQRAINLFIGIVNKENKYATVIFPAFVIKRAELKGQYAHWDGVKRKKVTKGGYTADHRWSGQTSALSLELFVFDGKSQWLFTSYGGLALPFYTDMKTTKLESKFRKDLFKNEKHIQSGVHTALLPILTQ